MNVGRHEIIAERAEWVERHQEDLGKAKYAIMKEFLEHLSDSEFPAYFLPYCTNEDRYDEHYKLFDLFFHCLDKSELEFTETILKRLKKQGGR